MSLAALDNAIYSALVDDRAVTVCFFDPQVMAPPLTRNMYPVVEQSPSEFAYAALA